MADESNFYLELKSEADFDGLPTELKNAAIADAKEAKHEYGVDLVAWNDLPKSGAIVAAVNHREFKMRSTADFLSKLENDGVITDVKSMLDPAAFARRIQREVSSWGVVIQREGIKLD